MQNSAGSKPLTTNESENFNKPALTLHRGGGIHMSPKILLKKQLSVLSVDAKRLLKTYLSTFYGKSMVTQGHLAVALDHSRIIARNLSMLPAMQTMMDLYCTNTSLALEEIQSLSAAIGDLEQLLKDAMQSSQN